jgi:hypothetical protein
VRSVHDRLFVQLRPGMPLNNHGSRVAWTRVTAWVTRAVTHALLACALALPGQAAAPAAQAAANVRGHHDTMRQIEVSFSRLKANNAAMNHDNGERDARRLEALLVRVRAFWQERRDEAVVRIVNRALAATRDAVRASRIMDMAMLAAAERTLSSSCKQCHALVRDRERRQRGESQQQKPYVR